MKNKTMKRNFKKIFLGLVALFLLLLLFRLAYGYTIKFNPYESSMSTLNSLTNVRKNYASKEYKYQSGTNTNLTPTSVDQKFEKVAEIISKSKDFEAEEKSIRSSIEAQSALIQFEQKNGNEGRRSLQFLIGVPPENFETLYLELTKVGVVRNKQITKKDKTNEYKELNSKKESLSKVRQSLIELKSKSGKIEEFINLENRILDIEQQLQELGVSLGDFDSENEFCTIKFSLNEVEEVKIGLLQRVKVALEWTIERYLMMIAILAFITVFSYFSLLILDKLKVFEKLK